VIGIELLDMEPGPDDSKEQFLKGFIHFLCKSTDKLKYAGIMATADHPSVKHLIEV
jgi:hypothetical protein